MTGTKKAPYQMNIGDVVSKIEKVCRQQKYQQGRPEHDIGDGVIFMMVVLVLVLCDGNTGKDTNTNTNTDDCSWFFPLPCDGSCTAGCSWEYRGS